MPAFTDGATFLASILSDDQDTHTQDTPAPGLAFRIYRGTLQALLDKAATVVPTQGSVMPVLKCFQITATGRNLCITATDTHMSLIVATSEATITTPGTAVFPAKKLLDIVKTPGSFDADLTVSGSVATITIGRATWTLVLQGGDDFPPPPVIAEAAYTTVDRTAFTTALTTVRYAASRDPNLASLNLVHIHDGTLTACNGSRIQQVTLPELAINLTIPITAVDDLLRLLKTTTSDTIQVGQSDTNLIFRLGTAIFIVKKYAGEFPDLEQTLLRPALENKHELTINRAELVAVLKRVRINADTDSAAIALSLNPGILTITARDRWGNTASEDIPVTWKGKARTVVVNHIYLTDMINAHPDPTCDFRLGDDTKTRRSPLLLRHADGSVAVVQQMTTDWSRP